MKNIFKFVVLVIATIAATGSVYAANVTDSNASIFVNDEEIIGVTAKVVDEYTLVPVRFVSEKLGLLVKWDSANYTVSIEGKDIKVDFTVGKKSMISAGETQTIPVEPVIYDDRVFVPLRALSEALDIELVWNDMTNSISIYSLESLTSPDSYLVAPVVEYKTVFLQIGEEMVIPVYADPSRKIEVDFDKDKVNTCTYEIGKYDDKYAIFISGEGEGTASITLYYDDFNTSRYPRTVIDIRVVRYSSGGLAAFNELLAENKQYYKDILAEIEANQRKLIEENEVVVVDRDDKEYERLFIGDKGTLMIPVDYSSTTSGEFNLIYDKDSSIVCTWGEYDGKKVVIIKANSYGLIPIRIEFTPNNNGQVTFTTTDFDLSTLTPSVKAYGNNDMKSAYWDIVIHSLSESSYELEFKKQDTMNRIVYVK